MKDTPNALKRGIDVILKSDKYTDEYKTALLNAIGNDYNSITLETLTDVVNFELLKNGGLVITENPDPDTLITVVNRSAAVSGYLEKPKYLEDELTKSIDVRVNELIKSAPDQKSETIPLTTYKKLQTRLDITTSERENLRDELRIASGNLITANSEIQSLLHDVDAVELLNTSSENQLQASSDRYISLLQDFQNAMQKGIQEAIERVSLSARVEGLVAQKEVLKEQLIQLNAILAGQADVNFANLFINKTPGYFGFDEKFGWAVPQHQQDTDVDKPLFVYAVNPSELHWYNGPSIELFNLESQPVTVTVAFKYNSRDRIKPGTGTEPWAKLYSNETIIIPASSNGSPGRTFTRIDVDYIPEREWDSGGFFEAAKPYTAVAWDDVILTFPSGVSFTIPAVLKSQYKQ